MPFKHGESDATKTEYADYLIELQADLDTDIRAITGQQGTVQLLCHNPASQYTGPEGASVGRFGSAIRFTEAAAVNPNIILTGVDYASHINVPSIDIYHLSGHGYFGEGECMWPTMAALLADRPIPPLASAVQKGLCIMLVSPGKSGGFGVRVNTSAPASALNSPSIIGDFDMADLGPWMAPTRKPKAGEARIS